MDSGLLKSGYFVVFCRFAGLRRRHRRRRPLRPATRAWSFGRMARRLARLLNATSEPLQFSRDELVPMSKTESSLAPKLIDHLSPPTRLCGSPRSLRRGPRSRTRGLRQEFARLARPLARPTERIPRSPSRRRHDAARQTGSGACACIWPVALEKTECTRPRRRVPHARSGAATRHTRAARALRAALCPPPQPRPTHLNLPRGVIS